MISIVTDSGVDLNLDRTHWAAFDIHSVPLIVTLSGEAFREGVDLSAGEFYPRLAASGELPTTSQPSPGDFAEIYRALAQKNAEILSIHMSSGLSGTFHSAVEGARMVPEARVTHFDTKTLSVASGWMVEAAARTAKAGWTVERIVRLLYDIAGVTETVYTLAELRYLIHGGRISHMKGLLASVLNIKPIIGVEKSRGTYEQRGSARTFSGALRSLTDLVAREHGNGAALRVQVVHAENPDGAAQLHDLVNDRFRCTWLPSQRLSLVLGAHTGPSLVGLAYAPVSGFSEIPSA